MQQIERYGVIALVFLLVTIVAVSFWGDSKSPGFWSRLTGRGGAQKMEIAKNPATAERALDNALPLSPAPNANPNPAPPPAPAETANAAQPQSQALVAGAPAQPHSAEAAIANASAPIGMQGAPNPGAVPMNAPAPNAAASAPAASFAATTAQPNGTQSGAAHPSPLAKSESSAAKKSAVTSGSSLEYVVQKGDSLASIAQKSLGSSSRWTEIQSLNGGIQPKSLKVGTKLKLPATAAKTALEKSAPKSEPPTTKKTAAQAVEHTPGVEYVVRSGDTLRTIAEKKLGHADRWKDIVAANPGLDPHKLLVGKSLKIPAHEARDLRDAREPRDTGALVAAATPSSSHSSAKPHVR
jgi:nucleoid-associated protein YgaU